MDKNDHATIQAVLSGDKEAYGALVAQHSRGVFRVAYRITGNEADAEEVVQDVFMRGYRKLENAAAQYSIQPWAWAVCHSGSWIYRGDHYVWVAGRRHHHPCVHWIKSGRTVAFVPIHPRDVKNHLPVNGKAPVFAVNPKGNHLVERIAFGNTHPIELLNEPPREFRNEVPMPLPRASEPRTEGHKIKDTFIAKGAPMRPPGIPLTFDHHSQSFMMPNHTMEGGRPATGFAPITNRGGDLQSHGGAFNGSGGFHGGGGSVAYGGGGSHGGGGGSSSGSASSGSSGGSGGGASAGRGGGSHK